jgi:hypothetical protein
MRVDHCAHHVHRYVILPMRRTGAIAYAAYAAHQTKRATALKAM